MAPEKKILMIGTGGTIAAKVDQHGLQPGLTPEEILSFIPQVKDVCQVETLQICNVDSTNIKIQHWQLIVSTIEENYNKFDGFVICHGTDTMAYTAAALSYMIQNSSKPIVITGSQKPIDLDITDGKSNLLDSFIYASDDQSQGVDLVFNGKVIVGTRAKKTQSKSYHAFSSINFPYPALIQDGNVIRYIPTIPYQEAVKFHYDMNGSVVILKMIPEMQGDLLEFVFQRYDCVIIESFGVGGVPDTIIDEFYKQMEKYPDKFVIMTTQVAHEGSNMKVYQVGGKVKKDFNMLESFDMTLEATITKAMWLLSDRSVGAKELRARFNQTIHFDIMHKQV